ncbi:hypothetical protein ACHAWF_012652 [Thalassiosira exigua]
MIQPAFKIDSALSAARREDHSAINDASSNHDPCPICINDMSAADAMHPIQCPPPCNFNLCLHCLVSLLAASKDDYAFASDGNRHVKVRLSCPNCRTDISKSTEDTIRSRRRSSAAALQQVPDDELSLGELRLKHWIHQDGLFVDGSDGDQRPRDLAPAKIDITLLGGLQFLMTKKEQTYVTQLMTSGNPEEVSQAAQILSGIAGLLRKGKGPPKRTNEAANDKAFDGRFKSAESGSHISSGSKNELRSNFMRRQMGHNTNEKFRRPLPVRMPLCVTLTSQDIESRLLNSTQGSELTVIPAAFGPLTSFLTLLEFWFGLYIRGGAASAHGMAKMTFIDDVWDGTVADAFTRTISFGSVSANQNQTLKQQTKQTGIKNILTLEEWLDNDERKRAMPPPRSNRVLVRSVHGRAAQLGIMRGDVVTHVNGEAFTGNAADLKLLLLKASSENGENGSVMIVVNAEECTAKALHLRSYTR